MNAGQGLQGASTPWDPWLQAAQRTQGPLGANYDREGKSKFDFGTPECNGAACGSVEFLPKWDMSAPEVQAAMIDACAKNGDIRRAEYWVTEMSKAFSYFSYTKNL